MIKRLNKRILISFIFIFFIFNIFQGRTINAILLKEKYLIKNAGFELGSNSWGIWNANGKLGTAIDSTQKYEGNQSFKMFNSTEAKAGRGTVAQIISGMDSARGKKLVLTQAFKSENLQGNGVAIRARLLNKNNQQIGDLITHKIDIKGNTEWVEKTIEIAIPNDTNIKNVEIAYMYDNNTGNLWIDKIKGSIEEIDTGLIKNAGFELGSNSWGIWNANGKLGTAIDSTQKYEGNQSFKMFNSTEAKAGRGTVAQIISGMDSARGKKLVLTQAFKSENLQGNGVAIRARLLNKNNQQIGDLITHKIDIKGNTEWVEKTIEIAIPNDTNIKNVEIAYMYDNNTGNLWIDKIKGSIEEIDTGLIKNAGFELGSNSWGIWNANGKLGTAIDSTQKYEGNQSFKMFNSTEAKAGRGTVAQIISGMDSARGKKLVLTQAFKSENLQGNGVAIRARLLNKNNQQIGDLITHKIDIKGNTEWVEKTIEIAIPNDTNIKNVEIAYMYDNNTGNLWIDKIKGSIEEIDTGLIKNAGFELGSNSWGIWNANGKLGTAIDSTQKYEGNQSFKMFNSTEAKAGRGTVAQIISGMDSARGKKLVLTQAFKSENLQGNGVAIRARLLNKNNQQIGDLITHKIDIKGNTEWVEKTIEIAIPNDTNIKNVEIAYMYDNNTGNLWIDKIKGSIEEIDTGLIKNAGFELGSNSWGIWNANGKLGTAIDSTQKYEGNQSFKMFNSTEAKAGRGTVAQIISGMDSARGKKLVLTQAFKSENLQGNGVAIRARLLNKNNQQIGDLITHKIDIKGNTEWVEKTIEIAIPNDTNIKNVEIAYMYDNNTGNLWIDKIKGSIEEIDTGLIKNAGFELGSNSWGIWNANGKLGTAIDSTQKYEGNQSFKMFNSTEAKAGRGTVAQIISGMDSARGKKLVLTQAFKSENLQGNGVAIRARLLNKNNQQIGDLITHKIDIKGNTEWVEKTIEIAIPNDTNIKNVEIAYMYDNNTGNLWIDKIKGSIEEIDTGLIKNAGFELGSNSWGIWNANGKLGTAIDSTQKYEGNQSFKMFNSTEAKAGRGTVAQIISGMDSARGKKLVLTQAFKSENLQGNGVAIRARLLNKNNQQIGDLITHKIDIKGNTEWVEKTIEIAIPNDTNIKNVEIAYMYDNNTGNLWIDGVLCKIINSNIITSNSENIIIGDENTLIEGVLKIQDQISKIDVTNSTNKGSFHISNNGVYKYNPNKNFYGYDYCEIKITDINGNEKIQKITVYVAPSIEEIKNSVKNTNMKIMLSKNKIIQLKESIKTDSNLSKWYKIYKTESDKILSMDVVPYTLKDGVRLDVASSKYIINMSFMYKITDDKIYLDRAWKEIDNIINTYKDWNPEHLLDTAELSFAFSIAYDWLYEDLTTNQKNVIKNQIIEKSLNIVNKLYDINSPVFVTDSLNWNIINNSAFIISALSIYDGEELLTSTIQNGFKSLQNSILTYYDGGDTKEGVVYWEYATRYLIYLLDTINTSMDIENSFIDLPGLNNTGEFIMNMSGNKGIFNYYDAENDNYVGGDAVLWLAKQFNKAELAKYSEYYKEKVKYITPYDFIWYDANIYNQDLQVNLDAIYNKTVTASMRSSWFDEKGSYIAFKGGLAGEQHGDLDIGSFVYEALGVRWAIDLGVEDYNSDGYWDLSENSNRWNLYRKKAEGHNTLVIGSQQSPDQQVGKEAKFIETNINVDNPYTVLDMSSVYNEAASKILRKFELINNREEVKITDVFEFNNEDTIQWQMHTMADIEILEGGKIAILSSGNKRLVVELKSNIDAIFSVEEASSKIPQNQTENKGVKKLVAKAIAQQGTIEVHMRPEKTDNLIDNGSFEDGIDKWGIWNPYEELEVSIDENIKKDKNKSIKFINNSKEKIRGSISQFVEESELILGKEVELSQWIKTKKLEGNGIEIRVSFLDKNNEYITEETQIYPLEVSKDSEWKNKKVLIPIPNNEDIKSIEIVYMYKDNIGEIWIDDVYAKVVGDIELYEYIKNASFKYGLVGWGEWNSNNDIKVSTDNEVKVDDTQSLRIENSTKESGRGSVGQVITNLNNIYGKDIEISQWIKTKNLNGNGLKVRIRLLDKDNNQIGNITDYELSVLSDLEWENKKVRINILDDNNIKGIEVSYLYDSNIGVLWIDNIGLEVFEKDGSILKNNSFEYDMSNWGVWNASGTLGIAIDRSEKIDSEKSLNVYNTTTNQARGTVSQVVTNIENMRGKDLVLTQYIKTEKLIGNGVKLRVRFFDIGNKEIEKMQVQEIQVEETMSWKETKSLIEIPNNENIKSIEIAYMYDSNTGKLWIDKIDTDILEQSAEIIKNPGFEYDLSYWGIWNAGNLDVVIDNNIKYLGNKSLKIYNKKGTINGRGTVSQAINNINQYIGKELILSQNFKSSNLVGDGVKIRIRYLDYNNSEVEPMKVIWVDVKDTIDWTNIEVRSYIPNNSKLGYIEVQYLYDNNIGELWIDNVKSEIVD